MAEKERQPGRLAARFNRLRDKAMATWNFAYTGVWQDTRRNRKIDLLKTVNLSVRSFLSGDLQSQSMAMTYRTLLAVVPALALLFAVGKGFGLQNVLSDELYSLFPAQKTAIEYAMRFIDSYLSSYSEGLFVGVGIVFLLYTLISLLSSTEEVFNRIWGVKQGRSTGRKLVDYTAMLFFMPVLMICAGGLNVMVSSTLQAIMHWTFLTPVVHWVLESVSWVLTWLFFGMLYLVMPNTKVKLANAMIAGVLAGTGFLILQWLFVSGQMYVSRYNAIYGSFSFLPLMLIWFQLTWLIVLTGGVVCYSSQNIFQYSFNNDIDRMSSAYYARLMLAICAIVVQRFMKGRGATTIGFMVEEYNLPPKLCTLMCDKLVKCGILAVTVINEAKEEKGFMPALDPDQITVEMVYAKLNELGSEDFIPDFNANFPGVAATYDDLLKNEEALTSKIKVSQLEIKLN